MILKLKARLTSNPNGLTDFQGAHLALFNALCRIYAGNQVHVWFEDVEERTPNKMRHFFHSYLIPYIMDITGDDNPLELEKALLHRFGFTNVPFSAYTFKQMQIFIDAVINFFQIERPQ